MTRAVGASAGSTPGRVNAGARTAQCVGTGACLVVVLVVCRPPLLCTISHSFALFSLLSSGQVFVFINTLQLAETYGPRCASARPLLASLSSRPSLSAFAFAGDAQLPSRHFHGNSCVPVALLALSCRPLAQGRIGMPRGLAVDCAVVDFARPDVRRSLPVDRRHGNKLADGAPPRARASRPG